MAFIFPHNPLQTPKIVAIKERSSLAPCGEKKVITKKAYSMGNKNYVVLPPRVRPIPKSDLTIFGGSSGTRRYYKAEKYEVPEFVGKLQDQNYSTGDNFVLRIGYKGCPEPLVQWFKGQEAIINDPDSTKLVINSDSAYAQLALFNAKREDGGYYSCKIENTNGVREMGCHIFITEGSGGPGGIQRSYRSVLYTPSQRYSRY
ncbi:Ig-like domain-containing protein [Meloidogyne graminicola]|uniref:Ig-like domain-containing protein n=1 Tax=Meloidogyne graminicola TaxID=189291 RepID=A0A8S9ZME9_9BILA|nr:Ig-like domain-containing protein [Meloidogyne graminicola]